MSNTKTWPDPDTLNNAVYILDPATQKAAVPTGVTTITNDGSFTTATDFGAKADTSATSDTGTFSLISLFKRALTKLTSLVTNTTGLALESGGNLAAIPPLLKNQDNTTLITASNVSTTQTSSIQSNLNARGVKVWFKIDTVGTSLTLNIKYKDPVTNSLITALSSGAISSNGFTQYTIYPGIPNVSNVSLNDVLPLSWLVEVTGAASSSFTVSSSTVI